MPFSGFIGTCHLPLLMNIMKFAIQSETDTQEGKYIVNRLLNSVKWWTLKVTFLKHVSSLKLCHRFQGIKKF